MTEKKKIWYKTWAMKFADGKEDFNDVLEITYHPDKGLDMIAFNYHNIADMSHLTEEEWNKHYKEMEELYGK